MLKFKPLAAMISINLLFNAHAADVVITPSDLDTALNYYNSVDINGSLIVSTEVTTGTSQIINDQGATISGGMVNNGDISLLANGQGGEIVGDNNSGIITGSMVNNSVVNSMLNAKGSSIGGDMVNNGTLNGYFDNLGTISGSLINNGTSGNTGAYSVIENIGTIGGDMINAGTALGTIFNDGNIGGSLINEGNISSNPTIDSHQDGTLNNKGRIDGSLVNTLTGTINGSMLNDTAGTVAGNMVNAGKILSDGNLAGDMDNRGMVSGSMINSGIVGVLESSTVSGMYNNGTISGDMITTETGTVIGAMDNNSIVSGNMINQGTVDGDPVSERADGGSMANKGTIGGSMENASGATLTGEMRNDAGAVISGDMVNAGEITVDSEDIKAGRVSGNLRNDGTVSGKIINTGTIYGGIVNTGTVEGGIFNSGNVVGDAALGDASLTLAGADANITGIISGSDASALYVGDTENGADYTAKSGNTASTGTISVAENSRLTLSDGVQWSASSSDSDAIRNGGTIILSNSSALNGNLINTGTLGMSDETSVSATVNGNITNSGSIVLNPTPASAGNTLTIDGNYTGTQGSTVSLGTVLGGDDSLTDRLVVTGSTSGSSTLYVANENGSGAQTLEGIQLIEVDGTSSGTFAQGNRIVAGAYDYSLVKGTNGWYLTSVYVNPTPTPGTRAVRPEAASYTANLQAANSMFAMSLHDREGEKSYSGDSGGMWLRQVGGRNKATMSDGQNKTSANRYVVQLGGTLWKTATGVKGSLDTGVMGGYASQRSHTRNSLTGFRSTGSVDGYSVGVYATWYQDAKEKSGLYVDSWLQYAWFNNEVKGDDLAPETYNSRGLTASAESGYNWQAGKWTTAAGMENTVWLQPHAQVIWSGIRTDDHTESNGTRVTASDEDNVQLRTGLRAYINGKSALDRNTGREFQPFVEANWIYNTRQYGTRLNSDNDSLRGTRNAGEIKAGIEAHVTHGLSVWTDVAQVMGGSGYSDTQGTLGLRYRFR